MGMYTVYHSLDNRLHYARKTSDPVHVPIHSNKRWELIYIAKSANVVYTIGDKCYRLGNDCLIITRPTECHSVTYSHELNNERWVIQFEEPVLHSRICSMIPPEVDVLDCSADKTVYELLCKMDRYINILDKETAKEMLISLIQELLCDIKLKADSTDIDFQQHNNNTVARAIRYMKDNLERPITVGEVATHLYISAGYLQRLFMEHLQVSPKQYILSLKLTYAQRDLCRGERATRVWSKYGFADYSSFYRKFIKHFGYKPSEAKDHADVFDSVY